MGYLIFDQPGKFEYGFKPFKLTPENIKNNQGASIVYLRNCDIESSRGLAFPRYITIGKKRYSTLYSYDGNDSVDIRDVVECGIKIN